MEPMLPKLEKERDNLLLGEVAALLHDVGKCHNDFIKRQLGNSIAYDYENVVSPQKAIGLRPDVMQIFSVVTTVREWTINLCRNTMVWRDPTIVSLANTISNRIPAQDSTLTKAREIRDFMSLKGIKHNLDEVVQQQKDARFVAGKIMGAAALYALWQNNDPGVFTNNDAHDIQEILLNESVSLLGEKYRLGEILLLYHGDFQPFENLPTDCIFWLGPPSSHQQLYTLSLLNKCHGVAHVDKAGGIRPLQAFISTAFGSTKAVIGYSGSTDLTSVAMKIPFARLQERSKLIDYLRNYFQFALGDTSKPFNEITLWDWSWSVAALYKAALAKYHLTTLPPWPQPIRDLKWRTLRVTVDVLGLLAKAHRIPDTLGYRRVVDRVFRHIKYIVEEKYPLGNEIYRDSTGIYFTFPDLAESQLYEELRTEILALPLMRHYPELTPVIDVGTSWGEQAAPRKWADAPKMLKEPHQASKSDIKTGSMYNKLDWQKIGIWQVDDEVCPVCGIRGFQKKGRDPDGEYRQQRCNICEKRTKGILAVWQKGVMCETPWLDEIADQHDRIALIVGRFELDEWLSGKIINTLPAAKPTGGPLVAKEPSPARIMRVWRTTEEFWTTTQGIIAYQLALGTNHLRNQRWQLTITWDNGSAPRLKESVLDGLSDGVPISIFPCDKTQRGLKRTYVTIMNVQLCKGLTADRKIRVRQDNGDWREGIINAIQPMKERFSHRFDFLSTYQPTRTILTSPDQFLALVPGVDALEIARQIAAQYAEEMGKVRSRLPLDLALVYFHRKMPLYAVMDAARRFLDDTSRSEAKWKVMTCSDDPATRITKVAFANGVDWKVSTGFGDGSGDDFYPYIALANGCKPRGNRNYTVHAGKPEERTYTHISELGGGDEVWVAPSRFSYLWLDNSTRRYSIGAPDGDAPFATQQVPLEEIELLTTMWQSIKSAKITDTTLHGVIQLLLEKRMAWNDDATFAQFARDVLRHSNLYCVLFTSQQVPSEAESLAAIERLFRCFDLHHRIMKVKLAD
jgi:hypothetical protein